MNSSLDPFCSDSLLTPSALFFHSNNAGPAYASKLATAGTSTPFQLLGKFLMFREKDMSTQVSGE